jgi:phosphoglycolate phosphatase
MQAGADPQPTLTQGKYLKPEAIIFDFDGTLAELNIDFDWLKTQVHEQAKRIGFNGGWPGGYLLEEVQALAGDLGQGFANDALAFIQQVEMEAASRGRLFPYTRCLLAQVRETGFGLAVISRNCGPAIRMVFPEIDDESMVFLPREAVKNTKPHPGHILDACLALKARPEASVVVGDHPMDITTALSAGCIAVGVASGRMSEADLRQAGAALVLPDASNLLAELEALY